MKLSEAILIIARREIGVTEQGTSNRGPRVDDYQRATWLDPEDWGAWCAAFVDFCVMQALTMANVKETATFERPRTAGAWDLEHWCRAQDDSVMLKKPAGKDILPGDILCFTFSHTGFAVTAPDKDGYVQTIEGNSNANGSRTGGMVCKGRRHISLIRSRIRFQI